MIYIMGSPDLVNNFEFDDGGANLCLTEWDYSLKTKDD